MKLSMENTVIPKKGYRVGQKLVTYKNFKSLLIINFIYTVQTLTFYHLVELTKLGYNIIVSKWKIRVE